MKLCGSEKELFTQIKQTRVYGPDFQNKEGHSVRQKSQIRGLWVKSEIVHLRKGSYGDNISEELYFFFIYFLVF